MDPRAKPEAPVETANERTIVTGYIPNQAKELDEYYVYTHPTYLAQGPRTEAGAVSARGGSAIETDPNRCLFPSCSLRSRDIQE